MATPQALPVTAISRGTGTLPGIGSAPTGAKAQPAPEGPQRNAALAAGAAQSAASQALVQVVPLGVKSEPSELSGPVLRLPVELDVAVPVREFRVRNLLALAPGQLIESQWGHGIDIPLAAGEAQLAWTEFEVVDARLAVRVTRLA